MHSNAIRPVDGPPRRHFETAVTIDGRREEFPSSENTLRTNILVTILHRLHDVLAREMPDADPTTLKAIRLDIAKRFEEALERGETRFGEDPVSVEFTEISQSQEVEEEEIPLAA